MKKYVRIFLLWTSCIGGTHLLQGQAIGNIYFADSCADKFAIAIMARDFADYSLFHFLDYSTLRHNMKSSYDTEKINRIGLLLPAKSTFTYCIDASADFGNSSDSCSIRYETIVQKTRNGRSATVSIMNIFSRPSERVAQSEPDTTLSAVHSQGIIYEGKDSSAFLYKLNYKGKKMPTGWLQIGTDTLLCKPVPFQYKRKGKLKKANYYFLTGFLLKKGDEVMAAIDQSGEPDAIYLSNKLTTKERLAVAAYLFIVACYQ